MGNATGADVVIAVDLNSDMLGRYLRVEALSEVPAAEVSE
jgi:hypothetical protein